MSSFPPPAPWAAVRPTALGILTTAAILALAPSAVDAAPEPAVIDPPPDSTVDALTAIEVTFSEAVTGVDPEDLLVSSVSATTVSGSGAGPYRFVFTQPPPGEVSASWDFDHGIAGTAGTGALVIGEGWVYLLEDTVPPAIARILAEGIALEAIVPAPNAQVTSLTEVEITFSEAVKGVDAGDLLVKGVAAASVTGAGAGPYRFTLAEPPSSGIVSSEWVPDPGIVDGAGNAFEGGSWFNVVLAAERSPVRITEILAANAAGRTDEDGDTPDWIELSNLGTAAVNLTGWSLTTDPDRPDMWTFPSASIPAGGRLVVYASAKDRKPASGALHTNFKLDRAGGYLGLFGPESPRPVVDALVDYPEQRYDHSYGFTDAGEVGYFVDPTPGAANGPTALTAVAGEPSASVSRGFFAEPFTLVLSAREPGTIVRFTLDGTEPTASSPAYEEPIVIGGTTVLRAAAFGPGLVPSATVTHSYVFLDQALDQPEPPYDNPSRNDDDENPPLPLVGDVPFPIDWGTQSGGGFPGLIRNLATDRVPADYGMDAEIIGDPTRYDDDGNVDPVNGRTNLERIRAAFRELPLLSIVMDTDDMFGPAGLHPNSRQKGDRYEMPCSLELLLPDGTSGFSVTCGIRMHGNASREPRKCPKHGFKLNFKTTFGASELGYALFPDSPNDRFDDIILRGDFNSSWVHWDGGTQRPKGTRLRDAFCKDSFRAMGRAAGHHRYVHLFINGLYWGTYDATEQENSTFAANTFGGTKDDYDVVEQGQLKSGTIAAYNSMRAIPSPITNDRYEEMKGLLDVPWFIDYMLLHFYLGHEDWGADVNKNWYAVRHRGDGKFRYLPWDMENLMWDQRVNRVTVSSPPTGLHPKLNTNVQYRLDFADRVHRHLVAPDGALRTEASTARWRKWRSLMQDAIVCESARWGDYRRDVHPHQSGPYPLFTWNQHWITENERLENVWFPQRPEILLAQLRAARLYPSVGAPILTDADAAPGEAAPLGSRTVTPGFQLAMSLPDGTTGTIWHTTDGSDPRVYYDTTGARTPTAEAYAAPITLDQPTVVKARTLDEDGTTWSALMEATFSMGPPLPPVRITEIHYNPTPGQGDSAGEFIEIQNTGPLSVDVSGWSMRGVEFVFPYVTVLGPGDRMVLASNDAPNVFAAQHPGVQVGGYFRLALSNAGERLALVNREGRTVTAVEFDDEFPWDDDADGAGHSLELVDPTGDPQSPFSWRASAVPNGTPGTPNGVAPAPSVVLSEILALNDGSVDVGGAATPFVELHHSGGGGPIALDGWSIRPRSPSGAVFLPAGSLLAPDARLAVPTPAIDPGWDQIALVDASGRVVDGVRTGPQASGLAFARLDGEWIPALPTPGLATPVAAAVARLDALRLNEWLAAPGPDADDWLELVNTDTERPVALTGLHAGVDGHLLPYPVLAAVAPGGFLRLDCDAGARRANALLFNLPAEGARLELADAAGSVFDSVDYPPQTTGRSEGRLPDATGPIVALAHPSPGLPNHGSWTDVPLLNEILTRNEEGPNAPWGRRSSWLEIRSPDGGGPTVDLAGWRLRTVGTAPRDWAFADGTALAPGEHLLVWCEPEAAPGMHSGAHHNSALPLGDVAGVWGIELVNPVGQIVDRMTWGAQIADRPIGRDPDGRWVLLDFPTPGTGNAAAAGLGSAEGSVRLNEWFADSADAVLAAGFIELFNTGTRPVDLGGLWLSDEPSEVGRRKFRIPDLSFVDGGGHALFAADGPGAHPATLPFNLAAGGESVRIGSGVDADTVVDVAAFGRAASPLLSEGSLPDGSTNRAPLAPTPGAANSDQPGPVFAAHPRSQAILAGEPAEFEVSAPDADSVQWLLDGSPIEGATSARLVIPAVQDSDQGEIVCLATNGAGSRASRPARLTVLHSFATWSDRHGIQDPTEDADRDFLTAFEEFLLDSDPAVPLDVAQRDSLRTRRSVEETPGGFVFSLETLISRRAVYSGIVGRLSPDLHGPGVAVTPDVVEIDEAGEGVPDGTRRFRFRFAAPDDAPHYFLHGIEFAP